MDTPRVYHVDHPHNDTDDHDVGHAVKSELACQKCGGEFIWLEILVTADHYKAEPHISLHGRSCFGPRSKKKPRLGVPPKEVRFPASLGS